MYAVFESSILSTIVLLFIILIIGFSLYAIIPNNMFSYFNNTNNKINFSKLNDQHNIIDRNYKHDKHDINDQHDQHDMMNKFTTTKMNGDLPWDEQIDICTSMKGTINDIDWRGYVIGYRPKLILY